MRLTIEGRRDADNPARGSEDYRGGQPWLWPRVVSPVSISPSVLQGSWTDGQTQAVAWYSKSADQGHPVAQYNLGVIYERGQGVPQDYARAHMWFNLAASHARNDAFPFRGLAVKARDEVAAKMTPAQIDEAQRLTSEWTPK
jgi:TPR repeat protein